VELFEEIRREYAVGETIQGYPRSTVCTGGRCDRRSGTAIPPERKSGGTRKRPDWVRSLAQIERMLASDLQAPRKQRPYGSSDLDAAAQGASGPPRRGSHSARYVRERKSGKLGLSGRDVFVPQSYELGRKAVDWFEAVAILGGEARKCSFRQRSMGSGDAFHRAYPHATQQSAVGSSRTCVCLFGGVFKTLRYDNMHLGSEEDSARISRVETDRIIAFRSHWGTGAKYCNPAAATKKASVEGELGWFRRNWLVPRAGSQCVGTCWNQHILGLPENRSRTMVGRGMTMVRPANWNASICRRWPKKDFRN